MVNYLPLAVFIAILGFVLFRTLYLRCNRTWMRFALMATSVVLSVPAVLFLCNYMWEVPSGAWFFSFHSLPAIEASSGSVGTLLGVMFAHAKLHPHRLNLPVLAASVVVGIILLLVPFGKQLFYTKVEYSGLKNVWKDGVCKQTSGTTCMPASFATVVRLIGGNITEQELAREAGTNSGGTEVWYLIRVLRRHGYEVDIRTAKSLKDASAPAVIGLGIMGHVVVLMSKTDTGPEIGDPIGYHRKYTWKDFEEGYEPKPVYFVVRKVLDNR
jgi:biotin operon repressor